MTDTVEISVTKTDRSRLKDINLEDIPFGKYFNDHMLEDDYENGEWKSVEIKPYQPLLLEPSLAALHYGQAIFEGIKAYRSHNGDAYIFRPIDNFMRFNRSAARMNMPLIPEELFMEGMRQLIALDKDWIPTKKDHSLYIRPVMFAVDTVLGVRPSENYKFLILLSPTGPYYASPMKIMVEEKYTRAAPGGVGFSKNAGNYGGSMLAASLAKQKGYDQVLWTDSAEHKWLQEVGMMNVFFIIDKIAITPSLEDGTILEGVTRASVIQGLKDMNVAVEERKISIDEIVDAYKLGKVSEVFGTGTAAVIAPIRELNYKGMVMDFNVSDYKISEAVKNWLADLREGRIQDKHGWMWKV